MSISSTVRINRGTVLPAARKARLLGIGAALLATLSTWLVAELVLGIHLRAPTFDGSSPLEVTATNVALVTAILSLVGWGVMALLERFTPRPGRVWLIVAPLALVLSLGTPLSGAGVTQANRIVLMLMHLAAGAVLIPALYLTSSKK
jgi:hypothetical protein